MKRFNQFKSNKRMLKASALLVPQSQNLEQLYLQSTGFIGQFNLEFDLAWKTMKKLMQMIEKLPEAKTGSPRQILRLAFQIYPFLDEMVWVYMLEDRNAFTHVYDALDVEEAMIRIVNDYLPEFDRLEEGLCDFYGQELDEIL